MIRIPAWAQPRVRYEIAIVSRSDQEGGGAALDQHAARGQGSGGAAGTPASSRSRRRSHSRTAFRATLVVAAGVALAFLLLPIAAVFLRVPPDELLDALRTDAARDAIRVTLETNAISMVLILLFGTPTAYWVATPGVEAPRRRRDADRAAARAPARRRRDRAPRRVRHASACSAGRWSFLGIDIAFTKVAVVLAVTFVASPFYVRTAVSAFEAIEPTLPDAARTLGAGPAKVFFRVALPLAAGGLGAGAALAFARGIGEFGATIMFAGSLQGVTQTLSLAIYEQFDLDFDVALAISAVLIIVSASVLLVVKLFSRWRSNSTSPIPFARS